MSKITYNKVIWHVIFWAAYVVTEYLANLPHLIGNEHLIMLRSIVLTLPILMIAAYSMVYIAIPRLYARRKYWLFLLVVVVVLIFVLYGRVFWLKLINYLNFGYEGSIPFTKVVKNVIRDYSIIALAVCLHIIGDWKQKSVENQLLTQKSKVSDLELLKRQLQPHFLFNTLNNIYSLSLKQSEKTGQSILKLSDLLEYLVYQSGESTVPLIQEVNLLKNYIALEELRYGNDLQVTFNSDVVDEKIRTAPLILLPFVENCFKHGGKNEKGVFWIKISIKLYGTILKVSIENSKGKKIFNKNAAIGGVGLKNIADRLSLLYPDNHDLEITDNIDFYSILLELKL
jgi:sensor histidine kinase YesM